MREYTTDFAPWYLMMSSNISNGGGLYASVAFGGVVAILAWMMFFLSGKELNDISTWRIVKLLTGGVDMRARRRATQHFRVTRCTWIEASTNDETCYRKYHLSILDKMLCPVTIINMHYFYEVS
ncbi:hypothetical protein Naga_101485g1 [Nannochloropsis gaditana]|uniref:Uncharacterized protein n=1 Tax=Nannochloropsis gaditana TaxID=72520 RepID=W7T926_9STRA|nr:hypothetical protein Naga_101485g1 [Nannochloropsis gaditana]